jgi:hypothetical protein
MTSKLAFGWMIMGPAICCSQQVKAENLQPWCPLSAICIAGFVKPDNTIYILVDSGKTYRTGRVIRAIETSIVAGSSPVYLDLSHNIDKVVIITYEQAQNSEIWGAQIIDSGGLQVARLIQSLAP